MTNLSEATAPAADRDAAHHDAAHHDTAHHDAAHHDTAHHDTAQRDLMTIESSAALVEVVAQPPALPQNHSLEITLSGPAALLNNRAVVIAILCCAGPIGLPALWFSPRFSPITKGIVTAAFFTLTVVLPLAGAWYALEVLIRPIADALSSANTH
jgi:hypothetical protein